ncbi:hypothetical protein IB256_07125 [Pseudomonas sp. PDM17]|uniref:hypothetical protein n=1 Tax=Pseudomonas sp. PDM17 TaxID=2769285 RepID=UPI00177AD070|nr:hypothetical protein [Pseudomonas sp. PDM17]MBD9500543.1 hypothetical protein [Pseudomonas sp. PDM17]
MSAAMKWVALVAVFVIVLLVAIVAVSFSVTDSAEKDSRWIVSEMWHAEYFNRSRNNVAEGEVVNIMTLKNGASKREELLGYVNQNKCESADSKCVVNDLSVANILVDSGDFDSSMSMMVKARARMGTDECPISFESSMLRYREAKLKSMKPDEARSVAANTIDKIKRDGGMMLDLRTPVCDSLAQRKPEIFHEYVTLVSRVMQFGRPALFKVGAYIESVNKMDFN